MTAGTLRADALKRFLGPGPSGVRISVPSVAIDRVSQSGDIRLFVARTGEPGDCGRRSKFCEKDLLPSTHQIRAEVHQDRRTAAHLVPDAPERVVRQELHHIAWREELVAHGELAAVARGLALGAHLLALVVAVEVLVDPADGFVLGPDGREVRRVQHRQQIGEGLPARPQQAPRVAPVEQDSDLSPNLVEEALHVEPVAVVRGLRKAGGKPGELPEPGGLFEVGDALLNQSPRFQHLQRDKAVQGGKGRLPEVVGDRLRGLRSRAASMRYGGDELAPQNLLGGVQVGAGGGGDGPVQVDVEEPLQLLSVLALEKPARVLGRALDAVAGVAVHGVTAPAPSCRRRSAPRTGRAGPRARRRAAPPCRCPPGSTPRRARWRRAGRRPS